MTKANASLSLHVTPVDGTRKIKCDRELPHCRICIDTEQSCSYPSGPMKPGPKIGSLQRPRRRHKDQSRAKTTPRQPNRESLSSQSFEDASAHKSRSYTETELNQTSITAKEDDPGPCRRSSQLNIHDLSFILHPSHEASTPDEDETNTNISDATPGNEDKFQRACHALGLSESAVMDIVRIYFDNMVAINIFHEPSFQEGLKNISSVVQLSALLAAITGYAIRFLPFENNRQVENEIQWREPEMKVPDYFLNMALKLIDQALSECGDEPPSLCVLQALIVITHCQLTRGVLGRAWRSLGMCVRLAYELNLHLVDSRCTLGRDPETIAIWREDEEKRRAWWAIWEMDVFASTIRRTPTAINWTQMEVLLPVPDTCWYRSTPIKSCFFEQDPAQRWWALHETGNNSPKAWFIVINSLMKDGQIISCPRGVPSTRGIDPRQPHGSEREDIRRHHHDDIEESRQKLETLANAVHCFIRVLPDNLHYRHQYLSFHARSPGQTESYRQLHSSIYNIYVMTQLARLMIYRYDVFGSQTQLSPSRLPGAQGTHGVAAFQDQEAAALGQYFEAADNILTIVNRSCENHVQYINPFLSSTIWLAAAVQLVRKQFGGPSTKTSLIKTRFDLLYLTYKQCIAFWDTKTAMQQNLESLEVQLEGYQPGDTRSATGKKPWLQRRQDQLWISDSPSLQHSGSKLELYPSPQDKLEDTELISANDEARSQAQCSGDIVGQCHVFPETPPQSVIFDKPAIGSVSNQTQSPPKTIADLTGRSINARSPGQPRTNTAATQEHQSDFVDMPIVDFMEMPSNMDQDLVDMDPSVAMNELWKNFDLPSDIHDLLSGFSTY
ncbi:hypothetical protein BHE90_009742 [Fusarium euwallaceae]|uniref:Xylanolytic transcriptional activator regulatory domain-containing protein n=1 Tax=Fusarium euwallaceae TaxID=1147111 RepID=A0A430LJC7_9HYPO|nr:hypothetical protein BHE90_009742 [Fusarium euwallaceae]